MAVKFYASTGPTEREIIAALLDHAADPQPETAAQIAQLKSRKDAAQAKRDE